MRPLRATIIVLLAVVPIGAPARAQSVADDPRVKTAVALAQTWLEAQRAFDQIPGVSAGIVYDQQVVWSGGYGYADLARKAPATPSTIYSICSISKLFTSVGVMQLRDAGRLRLDDPVGKHLAWFTIKRTAPESGEITVEGLLTHASGLPRESDHPYWTGPDFTFPTREQIIERLSTQETLYPGFAVWRSADKTFVGHGGSCPGFRSQLLLKPDEKVATVFMANAQGVNAQQVAQRLYDIVAPALKAAAKEPGKGKPPDPDLEKYLGTYETSVGGEMAVVRWEDGLATLSLPTTDPVGALTKWKKTGDHTFRRIRKDDALGEALVFEMGPDGRPVRIRWNSQYYPRAR